jgi:hypothetical protein
MDVDVVRGFGWIFIWLFECSLEEMVDGLHFLVCVVLGYGFSSVSPHCVISWTMKEVEICFFIGLAIGTFGWIPYRGGIG